MSAELPTEMERADALELENLQLKAEKAQTQFERAVATFNACFAAMGERYKFAPAVTTIDFATRKIERK